MFGLTRWREPRGVPRLHQVAGNTLTLGGERKTGSEEKQQLKAA